LLIAVVLVVQFAALAPEPRLFIGDQADRGEVLIVA
jgi:hypothetical protein